MYIPNKGDVVWINFSPHAGHEQSGRRPGLVLSHKEANKILGLAFIAPITSKTKGYPFEVGIKCESIDGVALVDHTKSLDWESRNIEKIGQISNQVLHEVEAKLKALLF